MRWNEMRWDEMKWNEMRCVNARIGGSNNDENRIIQCETFETMEVNDTIGVLIWFGMNDSDNKATNQLVNEWMNEWSINQWINRWIEE